MAGLVDEVPDVVLAVYAHPDDPEVSAGGSLALWAGAGAVVHVCVCADGDKGSLDPETDPEELVRVRKAETAAAGAILGVSEHHWLGVPDGEIGAEAGLVSGLVSLIRRVKPTLVVAPDPTAVFFGQEYFNHRDHRICGMVALDAVSPAAALPHYFPGAGPAHQVGTVLLSGTLEPDVWVDISETISRKGEAVGCHRSQFPDGVEWATTAVTLSAEDAGRAAGVPYAEGFRRLRLGG